MTTKIGLLATFALFLGSPFLRAEAAPSPSESEMAAYLLVYFKDDTHSIHFALSSDGYRFTALNQDQPIQSGEEIAEQKGIRDPYIMRGPDGQFYLAMTDLHIFAQREGYRDTEWQRPSETYGWGNNRALVLMKSPDLIEWTVSNLRVDQAFPELADIGCAWAPELIYDEAREQIMLYFTMRFAGGVNRIYYTYLDKDFSRMETLPELLFQYPEDKTFIDGDITKVGDRYHLFYVPHDGIPGIKQAVSDSINSGYAYDPRYCDDEPQACEAPNVWKRIGEEKWVLMYDCYGIETHNFGFMETTDFQTFTPLGHFNEGVMQATNFSSPKHGAVIHLTQEEANRLAQHWNLKEF